MTQPDRYILLGSKHGRLSKAVWMETDPDWAAEYDRTRQCPGLWHQASECRRERAEYQINPPPVEPLVTGKELGFMSCLETPLVITMRDDAKAFFAPYLEGAVWGRVYELKNGIKSPTRYLTLLMSRNLQVDVDRGRVITQPKICKFCGQSFTWSASCKEMGLLRWQIRDRPVVLGNGLWLCVSPEFFEDMKLRTLFPDLKVVHKVKIYEKDPWGFVLPGDPEWGGKFRLPEAWKNRKKRNVQPDSDAETL